MNESNNNLRGKPGKRENLKISSNFQCFPGLSPRSESQSFPIIPSSVHECLPVIPSICLCMSVLPVFETVLS